MKETLIANGVRNLKEFGYPNCSTSNILTDKVYREFFRGLLEQWDDGTNRSVSQACKLLLIDIGDA